MSDAKTNVFTDCYYQQGGPEDTPEYRRAERLETRLAVIEAKLDELLARARTPQEQQP